MRINAKDVGATLFVAAVAVPYVGYVARGEMPLVEEPRAMAGIGLVLGAFAFFLMWRGDSFDMTGKVETAIAVVSLALGVVAYELSDTAAAQALLAVFMVSIVLVWAMKVVDHIGALPRHEHAGTAMDVSSERPDR